LVTRAQLDRLGSRIEQLAAALMPEEPIEYRVYLRFTGDSDDEFRARHPDYPADGRSVIDLAFEDPSHGHQGTA
jgi:hypothetical protein